MSNEKNVSRRKFLKYAAGGAVVVAAAAAGGAYYLSQPTQPTSSTMMASTSAMMASTSSMSQASAASSSSQPIVLGGLYPLTGGVSILGVQMRQNADLAIEEINNNGGVNGRQLVHVVEDTQSNPQVAVQMADKVVGQNNVSMIIGVLTSAERLAVASEVSTKLHVPFFSPVYYEGGLCNHFFFSDGAVPSQQVDPYVPWIMKNVGKTFYLIGSDYQWPRGTFAAVKKAVAAGGGTILGEDYFPFGTSEFSSELTKIAAAKPAVVFPLLAGSDDVAFEKQFYDFGLRKTIQHCSIGTTELEVAGIGEQAADGIITCSSYFMNINTAVNQSYVGRMKAKYGQDVIWEQMGEDSYDMVYLAAQALTKAGGTDPEAIISSLVGQTFNAPQGHVQINPDHHTSQNIYIGKVQAGVTNYFNILEYLGEFQTNECTAQQVA